MKRSLAFLVVGVIALWLANQAGRAQSMTPAPLNGTTGKGVSKDPAPQEPARKESAARHLVPILDTRSADALYQEANGYLQFKYAQFNNQKLPFDATKEAQTRQEQKELATRHIATLTQRGVAGDDLFYLAMLNGIAGNTDLMLQTLRIYLAAEPKPADANAQIARRSLIVEAVKKGQLDEAETVLADYNTEGPRTALGRYGLENLLATAYLRVSDYDHAAPHAEEMLKAARIAGGKEKDAFHRDEMLFSAVSTFAEINLKLHKTEEVVSLLQDLRRQALGFPSGNLFRKATRRLAEIMSPGELAGLLDPFSETTKLPETTRQPPEIVVAEWIDQKPAKLAELHGSVVLLDFWAPWCGPCRATFPKLQQWHETYKGKGLVILGVTNFFGQAEGRSLDPAAELKYLKEFKQRNRLPYGFAVANTNANDVNYGVLSIPTSVLIDRRGVVRFISIGANPDEVATLGRMIRKLVQEQSPEAVKGASEITNAHKANQR